MKVRFCIVTNLERKASYKRSASEQKIQLTKWSAHDRGLEDVLLLKTSASKFITLVSLRSPPHEAFNKNHLAVMDKLC